MLERLRRPDSYSRHLPPLSHAHPSEYANTRCACFFRAKPSSHPELMNLTFISHGRIRSYVYERAGAPTYPESSSESPSPREARPSLPLPQHSTMQSTSISFATTISATSTWAMPPSAHSPSSTSSSSPVSRARTQQDHRAIESEQGGVVSPKDRDLKLFEAAQRRPLPRALPSLPAPRAQAVRSHAHTHHPRESISPDRSRAASPSPLSTHLPAAPPSSTAEQLQRHAYAYRERETERDRQDSWSPESTWQPLPPMWCVCFPSVRTQTPPTITHLTPSICLLLLPLQDAPAEPRGFAGVCPGLLNVGAYEDEGALGAASAPEP